MCSEKLVNIAEAISVESKVFEDLQKQPWWGEYLAKYPQFLGLPRLGEALFVMTDDLAGISFYSNNTFL